MSGPRVGVVGAGYWGIHHVRNFARLGALAAVCDADAQVRARVAREYPGARLFERLEDLLGDAAVDAVVVATPAAAHAAQALAALAAGKHGPGGKPKALTVATALLIT